MSNLRLGLRFDIASQAMTCDHCGNDFEVEKLADSTSNDADSEASYDVYVYVCPDCGGELAVDTKNDAIGFCPYCGGASMLYDRIRKEWKPDTIIPFMITREQCKENYLRKVKKNPFISSQYRNPELIESFRGIYLPYWYFEGRQDGQYCLHETTTGKTSKEVTTTVFEKNYQVAYTLSGISFDASIGFDDHISEQLQPFDTDGQTAFHPGYLSGFYAEIGDADKKEYEAYACEQFQDYTRNLIIESEGSEAKNLIIPTRVQSVSHALHPVWFMSYRRKNELIYAAVNGQTGKVAADLPLSPLRILLAALLSVLLIFGAVNLVMNLLPSIKAGATLMICSLLTFTYTALLQDTYLTTLARCLHMPIRTAHPSIRIPSCIVTALLVAGIILIATDGSYGKARAIFGGVLSVPSFLYLVRLLLFASCLFIQSSQGTAHRSHLSAGKRRNQNRESLQCSVYLPVLRFVCRKRRPLVPRVHGNSRQADVLFALCGAGRVYSGACDGSYRLSDNRCQAAACSDE